MAQIILDSSNNLIQGDFDNATVNNRTKFKTTTLNATTNVYAVPNGSATSSGFTATNAADPTNASKITMATNGSTDTQIISGVNGTGTYLPLSFYTNNTLAMQIGTNGQITVAATANPAFSAYQNSAQTGIAIYTWTKVTLDTEEFDTNSNFSSSRFTPTIPGYYQFNASLVGQTTTTTYGLYGAFYKNGSGYIYGSDSASTSSVGQVMISAIIYLNGSTDYVELWGILGTSQPWSQYAGTTIFSMFNGCLIRSA